MMEQHLQKLRASRVSSIGPRGSLDTTSVLVFPDGKA
jgi:hypothetical protein